MLAKLLSTLSSHRPAAPAAPDQAAAAHAFLDREIAAGPRVAPPEAVANDPLAAVHAPVERALRRAGYLR